jgi:hypothetical protein
MVCMYGAVTELHTYAGLYACWPVCILFMHVVCLYVCQPFCPSHHPCRYVCNLALIRGALLFLNIYCLSVRLSTACANHLPICTFQCLSISLSACRHTCLLIVSVCACLHLTLPYSVYLFASCIHQCLSASHLSGHLYTHSSTSLMSLCRLLVCKLCVFLSKIVCACTCT